MSGNSAVAIPLTRGQTAYVDLADLHLVAGRAWQAHPRQDGRGFYAVNSDGVRMHRLLLNVTDERIVDHRDGDGLNNRRFNIRAGTQALNCVNRRTTPGPYLRGVHPRKKRWRACIKDAGKYRTIGNFATEQEAHAAFIAESRRLHGDWQPLPDPPGRP